MQYAGVEPCPNCHAPLIPDTICESCGYDPKATTCERCGSRFDGERCGLCGWSDKFSLCRNCGATLSDDHIVLKQQADDWVWKNCAYCGWSIEQYLYTILGQIEPYLQPYDDESSSIGFGFSSVILSLVAIFLIAALAGPVANLTIGHTTLTPSANVTSTTPNLTPFLQLYPLFFVFIGLIVIAKKLAR